MRLGTDPVSYTHLDVYKRQGVARTSDCVFVMREQVKNVADTLSSIGGYVPSYLDSKEKQGN